MSKALKFFVFIAVIAAAGFGAMKFWPHGGPGGGEHGAAGGPPGGMVMPAIVTVIEKKPMRLWSSYSGRIEAVDFVEVRPQVEGRIDEIKFTDGQVVAKDDVLFVIDPRPFEASMAEANAAMAAAKSQNDWASKELSRAEDLIKTEAISQRVLDERRNTAKLAKNALAAAEAMVEKAQINLDHAYVKAPISGRVSRAEITVGNLVQTGPGAPVLTSIVSNEGIYADFEVDEQTYLNTIHDRAVTVEAESTLPVQVVLHDKVYDGQIKSFDNRINISTGTIRARAYLPNEDGALLPGMFVTVRLGSPASDEVIILSEQAIGTDQDRKFVYVVGDDNKVSYRVVKLGASVDGSRVITAGLEPGEKVVSEGIMKIMPDMVVAPQIAQAPQPEPVPQEPVAQEPVPQEPSAQEAAPQESLPQESATQETPAQKPAAQESPAEETPTAEEHPVFAPQAETETKDEAPVETAPAAGETP